MILSDSIFYFDRLEDIVQLSSYINNEVFDTYNHSDDDLIKLVNQGKCISQVRRYLDESKFKDRAKLSTLFEDDRCISSIESLNLVLDYLPDDMITDETHKLLDQCCDHDSLDLVIKYMKKRISYLLVKLFFSSYTHSIRT